MALIPWVLRIRRGALASAGIPPSRPDLDIEARSPAGGVPLTREAYHRYIGSDRWRRSPARLAELEASGHSCRACDRRPPEVRLEVHHRTYVRLGHEVARDLTTFCSECHLAITDAERRRRHGASTMPALRDSWSCMPLRDLVTSEWIDG